MDKFRRNQIRALLQDDRFRAIELLKEIVLAEIKCENIKADDEFNTIWRTAQREAKVEGLESFFNRLMEEASNEY